jgi:polyisoprenoid-binding protein YceI
MRFVSGVALVLAWTRLAFGGESLWKIDPSHSSVQFAVRHLMVSTVRGDFRKVQGLARIDDTDLGKSSVEAVIDATSIDTRDARRDAHLKDTDFLDVAKYPTISFKSKSLTKVDDTHYKLKGDLTLHGVTRPVLLEVEGSPQPIRDPAGNLKIGGIARTKIDRQDYGISFSKLMDGGGLAVGNDIEITIDVELGQARTED